MAIGLQTHPRRLNTNMSDKKKDPDVTATTHNITTYKLYFSILTQCKITFLLHFFDVHLKKFSGNDKLQNSILQKRIVTAFSVLISSRLYIFIVF